MPGLPLIARRGYAMALALSATVLVAGTGCQPTDKPHDYGQQRPSVDDLDSRDRGLQSRDVNQAADQMAQDLLSDPELNRSRERWTMVVVSMRDETRDPSNRTNYDIFLQALKARIAKQGRGRVSLITNRDQFYDLRDRELEGGGRDPFGQGDGNRAGAPAAISPDYALTGIVIDMPRRGTNFYQMNFSVQNLKTREEVWTGEYQVKVER